MAARLVVAGANSALGRALLERALARPDVELVALVRSARAESELPPLPRERARVARVAWSDAAGLAHACAGALALVHLAGILVETPATSYVEANVDTARAAAEAARSAGVRKLVLASALYADERSANAYLRSKGDAEAAVRASGVPYTILRLPLVLGCASAGTHALARQARSRWLLLPAGGANREQPLDARDAADGMLAAALDPERARNQVLDLVGPENASLVEIVRRAAAQLGNAPRIVPIPAALLRSLLSLRTRLLGPGFSPDALDVMLGDVRADPEPAARALGLRLRPLDETLAHSLRLEAAV